MQNPDNRPVLIIGACAGVAVVLMLWALYGTNGPTSMDASKEAVTNHRQHSTIRTAKSVFAAGL
jgi:hypothetical protein